MVIKIRKAIEKNMSMPMFKTKIQTWTGSDLNNHDQLMNFLKNYHKVHITETVNSESYGNTLTWCLEHCKGKFRDIKQGDGLDWYFEVEEDATMFALKWA